MSFKHGFDTSLIPRPPEYQAWLDIRKRCFGNPSTHDRIYYQERGITMCDRWRQSFLVFISDVGLRPSPRHSLDRINNDGNYEPGNVRWATKTEQAQNRRPRRRGYRRIHRSSGLITYNQQSKTISEWSTETGINIHTLKSRLRLLPIETALTTPVMNARRRSVSQ